MSILHTSLSIPTTPQSLSSAKALSGGPNSGQLAGLTAKISRLSLIVPISTPFKTTPVRMGGGPRTYPGGVSKWQWKRMQAKKAKQLLKARLARERQLYEMRKRAELKAAVSELERPWEAVEKPPNLFSVSADEQVKVLADRFQKPGGLDLWSERDGPELFRPDNGLPSSRFFPKGVVHSIKPYQKTENMAAISEESESSSLEEDIKSGQVSENVGKMGLQGKGYGGNSRSSRSSSDNGGNVRRFEPRSSEGRFRKKGSTRTYSSDSEGVSSGDAGFYNREDRRSHLEPGSSEGRFRKKGSTRTYSSDSEGMSSGDAGFYNREDRRSRLEPRSSEGRFRKKGSMRTYSSDSEGMSSGFYNREDRRSHGPHGVSGEFRRGNSYNKGENMYSEVFDMSLQNDGSYGVELDN